MEGEVRQVAAVGVAGVDLLGHVGGRAQSVVGVLCAARWATVVPHDPAPRTTTRTSMRATLDSPFDARPRCRSRPSGGRRSGWPRCWTARARAALAREMADRVLTAAAPLPVAVVCDDDDVAAWAESRGARVLWRPGHGLNGAVNDAVADAGRPGPRPGPGHPRRPAAGHGLRRAARGRRRWRRPGPRPPRGRDQRRPSSRPPPASPSPTGRARFARHCAEAERLGLTLTVHRPPRLTWDVDVPADLDLPPDVPTTPLLAT